jgi:hypothetical protein
MLASAAAITALVDSTAVRPEDFAVVRSADFAVAR